MDLKNLGSGLAEVSSHIGQCGGMCVLDGEMHAGLASILSVKCLKCGTKFQINSSKRVKTADGHQRWVVDVAAVLGQMATGGGASSLTCSVTPMNVPGMPKRLYSTTERLLSDCMHQLLTENMTEAGEEERRLAVERADMHHGIPSITVAVDGGWWKRSHKHTYNAKSGVAVIFGQCTNRYCLLVLETNTVQSAL